MAGNKLAALAAIPETAAVLAGNLFFDVGATGAEVLQDPSMVLQAVLGDREQAATFQANRTVRRERLPTFEASDPTKQQQQRALSALTPIAEAVVERFPNAAQTAGEYLQDPSVQTVGQILEVAGIPVMRLARGIQFGRSGKLILSDYTPAKPGRLNVAEKSLETEFYSELSGNVEGAIKKYNKLPATKNGKIVSTDEARELSTAYRGDRTLAAAVHEPVSALSKLLWRLKLSEPVKGPVMLMSGGTGAGKTSGLKLLGTGEFHGIFDSNLQGFNKAVGKIDEALDKGFEVEVMHVYRDPVESFSGAGGSALTRAMKGKVQGDGKGRTVPIVSHVATHVGSNRTVKQLKEFYKDDPRVGVSIIDNTRGKSAQRVGTVDMIPDDIDPIKLFAEVKNELENARRTGRITEKVYRGFRGTAY